MLKKALKKRSTEKALRKMLKEALRKVILLKEMLKIVFLLKKTFPKYGSQIKQNFEEVHKHTQESAQKSPPKSFQGKKF